LKVTIEIDIPKDDYAALTKWLKHLGGEITIEETLQCLSAETIKKWLYRARRYMKEGKTALERFLDEIKEKGDG
jgi:hypothetical protein